MPTLAPKLPYQHPFAGGYPRRGGQALPTDADAIDYLNRVAAADGASVEVGIAQAIDAFVRGCKADGTWDAIQASCIMCGARTLSGALVPLKTPYGPDLVDIDALPTPSITDAGGSTGVWTPATRTMSNTSGTVVNAPSFVWSGYAATTGVQYRITGRFSGDHSHVSRISFGGVTVNYPAASSPDFSFTVKASTTGPLTIRLDSTLAPSSVTIESLSIREDSFTPTPYNFASGDYSRSGATPGLIGNGSTKYLDTNRANNADPQNDKHLAIYASQLPTAGLIYAGSAAANPTVITASSPSSSYVYGRVNSGVNIAQASPQVGFFGIARASASVQELRANGVTTPNGTASGGPGSDNIGIYARYAGDIYATNARIAFYSIGTSLSLSALDSRVTNMVTAIRFHTLTGLLPNDYDPATIAYITAAYAAGGTL